MKLLTGIAASLLLCMTTLAATKKNVEALRIQTPLILDAVLDEAVYSSRFYPVKPYSASGAGFVPDGE